MLNRIPSHDLSRAGLIALAVLLFGCGDPPVSHLRAAKVGGTVISEGEVDRFMLADPGRELTATRAYDPTDQAACLRHKSSSHSKLPTNASAIERRKERAQFEHECKFEVRLNLGKTVGFLVRAVWLEREVSREDVGLSAMALRRTFQTDANPRARYMRIKHLEAGLLSAITVDQRDVAVYYRNNLALYSRPEERDLRYVQSSTLAAAKKAKRAILTNGSWDAVARHYSTVGTVGTQTMLKSSVADQFGRAVFAARLLDVKGPVHGTSGWYVFQVRKLRPPYKQPLPIVAREIEAQLRVKALQGRLKSHFGPLTTCARRYRALEVPECGGKYSPRTP